MEGLCIPVNNKGFVRLVVIFLLLFVVAFGAFGIYTQIKGENIISPETQTGSNLTIKTEIPTTSFVSGGISVGYVDRKLLFSETEETTKLNFLDDLLIKRVLAGSVDLTSGKTLVIFYLGEGYKSVWAHDVLANKSIKLLDSEHPVRSIIFDNPRQTLLYISYVYSPDTSTHTEWISGYNLETSVNKVLYEVDGDTLEGMSISRSGQYLAYRKKYPEAINWNGSKGSYALAIKDLVSGNDVKESTSSAFADTYSNMSAWSYDDSSIYHRTGYPVQPGGNGRWKPSHIFKYELVTRNDGRVTLNPDYISWGTPTFLSDMKRFISIVVDTTQDTSGTETVSANGEIISDTTGTSYSKIALYDENTCGGWNEGTKSPISYKDNCHIIFYDNTKGVLEWSKLMVSPDEKSVYYVEKKDNSDTPKLKMLNLEDGTVKNVSPVIGGLVGWGTSDSELLFLSLDFQKKELEVLGLDLNHPLGQKVYSRIPNVYSAL